MILMRTLTRNILISLLILFLLIPLLLIIAFHSISDPHIYYNLAEKALDNDKVRISECLIIKGLKKADHAYFIKNHPEIEKSELEHRINLENGYLYSQYAWLRFKQNKYNEAYSLIKIAYDHKIKASAEEPKDLIRYGLIEYSIGNKIDGWNKIQRALIEDSDIENSDLLITKLLGLILFEKFKSDNYSSIIRELRIDNSEPLQDLIFQIDTNKIFTEDLKGNVVLLYFFSPACGSCRQELQAMTDYFNSQNNRNNLNIIFILNQPRLLNQAKTMFKSFGIDNPQISTLANINPYSLIKIEPTIWIIDKQGRIRYKHVGYRSGGELTIFKEIETLMI
jgi:peroxiredoxin